MGKTIRVRKTNTRTDRRNHRITKNTGRKAATAKRTFSKMVTVMITGTSVEAVKQTTSNIYALQNAHTKGGKDKRTVQITPMHSSDVETIFFGKH